MAHGTHLRFSFPTVSVECRSEATYLTLTCGHRNSHAQHFHYDVGDSVSCVACQDLAIAFYALCGITVYYGHF